MKLVKKMGTLSLISCAMLSSQFAWADNEWGDPEWANSAWYIGGGIGQSRANIDEDRIIRSLIDTGASSVTFSSDQRDTAYKLFVGKQLNKYFALEAGYFDLGKYSFNAATTPPGSLNGEVGFRGLNLDMLAQLPLSERFSIYARLGMNYAKTDSHFTGDRLFAVANPNSSDNKLNPKVGLGMEYKITEALAIRGEAERYRLNDVIHNHTDVDFYSINLVYKLGKPAAKMPVKYVAPPEPVVQEAAPVAKLVPPPSKPVPVSEKVTFSAKTLFDFDKSAVKPEGKKALDDLLKSLQGMNTEVMITVGHTDSIGSEEYNQKLSVRRADAVKAYLVSTGVDASRIYTEGKGETQSAADNKTTEGRAMNRRVTVEVVGSRP
ncbi:OmpA family protein [Undibacterium sp. Ren11W]|uniref:OmpA family protein n=1 Tax=Undibacterium sp. Ren11W TaxID=3413045 RepID=UPI003BF337B7